MKNDHDSIKHLLDSPGWPIYAQTLQEAIESYKMQADAAEVQFKRDWFLAKAHGLEEALHTPDKWLKK